MSDTSTFSVSSNGGVEPGYDRQDVVNAFTELFNVTPEKAGAFLDGAKLVKKSLSKAEADMYAQQLTAIGIPVSLKEENQPVTRNAGLELVPDDREKHDTPDDSGFKCPKCELEQDKSEVCTGCGIIFDKYLAASQVDRKDEADEREARRSPVEDEVDDQFSIQILLFPILAGIVGAFIWKIIAVTTGYELGLIAWAMGGAIGTVAAMSGGRGNSVGVACGVIALLAIFAGKYMAMSSFQADMIDTLNGDVLGVELQELYDEAKADAAAFALIRKDDDSIKSYMVKHEYSDAKAALFVTDEELQEFKDYTQPWLEGDELSSMNYNEFEDEAPNLGAAVEEISTVSLVMDSLGLLDLLFVFLGVSTAFQLGRRGHG